MACFSVTLRAGSLPEKETPAGQEQRRGGDGNDGIGVSDTDSCGGAHALVVAVVVLCVAVHVVIMASLVVAVMSLSTDATATDISATIASSIALDIAFLDKLSPCFASSPSSTWRRKALDQIANKM